jgi:hypothetical protein
MDDELADDHLKKDRNSELDSQSHERENNVGEKVVFWGHFCDLWDVSRRAYVTVAYFVYIKNVCSVKSPDNANKGSTRTRRRKRIINSGSRVEGSLPIGVLIASTIIIALEPLWINPLVFFWSERKIHYWNLKEDGYPRHFLTNRVKKVRESAKILESSTLELGKTAKG